MSILHTIPEADADATTAAMYDDDIADQGFVAAHTKVMALNPGAYAAWEALIGEIARPLGLRRYELVTLAAAQGRGHGIAVSLTAGDRLRCSRRTNSCGSRRTITTPA